MIVAKVDELIKSNKTNCPFKIAKNLGIEILYEDLGSTWGYYSKIFRMRFIHINENATEDQKKFICAHELGHVILHPDAHTPFLKKHTLFSTEKIEIEANFFAIQLLFGLNNFTDPFLLKESVQEYGMSHSLVSSFLDHKFF